MNHAPNVDGRMKAHCPSGWLVLVFVAWISASLGPATTWAEPAAPNLADQQIDASTRYRVTLWQDGDPAKAVTLAGSFDDLDAYGRKPYPEAVVQAVCEIIDGQPQWRINVKPRRGYGVYSVECPIIDLTALLGDTAQRLLVPYGDGQFFDDLPGRDNLSQRGGLPRLRDGVWYGVYPSNRQAMQMMIIDDGSDRGRGMMIWTPDGKANVKDFSLWKHEQNDHLIASVTHLPGNTGRPGVGFEVDYPVTLTPFAGGWFNATRVYRDWATQQFWCGKGTVLERVKTGELPDWLATQAVWTTAVNHHHSAELMRQVRAMLPDVGAIGVFLTQCQQHGFDTNVPEYFPPRDPEGYAKLMAMQDELNLRMFPYMNIHLAEMEYPPNRSLVEQSAKHGPPDAAAWYMTDYREYWGRYQDREQQLEEQLRAAWDGPVDEALLAKVQSDWFGGYSYQRDAAERMLREHWGGDPAIIKRAVTIRRAFKPMCSGSDAWHDYFLDMVTTNHQRYGTDGHYLDQLNTSGLYPCFSEDHNHEPGFGQAPWQGRRALIEAIRAANPGLVLFGECTSEVYLDVVQDAYGKSPDYFDNDSVPLFSSVYQGYSSRHEVPIFAAALNDPRDFAAALALSTYLGRKPGGFTTITTWAEMVKPEHKRTQHFLHQIAWLMARHNDTLLYGKRMADPVIETVPMQEVTWYLNKSGSKSKPATVPAVRATLWQSHEAPDKVTLLLSNSSEQPHTVTLSATGLEPSTRLKRTQGDSIRVSSDLTLTVPPLSWAAWTGRQR